MRHLNNPKAFSYTGGKVDQRTLEAALDFLVSIEPDPEEFAAACARRGLDDSVEYKKILTTHATSIAAAQAALTQYGRQISPATPEAMRAKLIEITRLPKYQESQLAASVCYSKLKRAWKGVNGWQV